MYNYIDCANLVNKIVSIRYGKGVFSGEYASDGLFI